MGRVALGGPKNDEDSWARTVLRRRPDGLLADGELHADRRPTGGTAATAGGSGGDLLRRASARALPGDRVPRGPERVELEQREHVGDRGSAASPRRGARLRR